MNMKLILIPLALLLFVFIYPFAEYQIDCPSAMTDPVANNDCTSLKHIMWVMVAHLSLTEYGFPADNLFFEATANPDAAESWSFIPMLVTTIVTAIIIKVKAKRDWKRMYQDELR